MKEGSGWCKIGKATAGARERVVVWREDLELEDAEGKELRAWCD